MNDDQSVTPFWPVAGAPPPGGRPGRVGRRGRAPEDLDASVEALAIQPRPDQIRIARLKKKKLVLRDEIVRLEEILVPDIIA